MYIELSKNITDILADLPEQGQGCQIVNIVLKNGKKLENLRVLSGYMLEIPEGEDFISEDIDTIDIGVYK